MKRFITSFKYFGRKAYQEYLCVTQCNKKELIQRDTEKTQRATEG